MNNDKNSTRESSARKAPPKVGGVFWFRALHEDVDDGRLAVVASRAKVSPMLALGMWTALMTHASRAEDRGSIKDFDIEVCSVRFGVDPETVEAMIKAFRDKSYFDGDRFVGWDDKQVLREDRGSTQRSRNKRERDRLAQEAELDAVAPGSSDNGCNDMQRNATHMQRSGTPRVEKTRIENTRIENTRVESEQTTSDSDQIRRDAVSEQDQSCLDSPAMDNKVISLIDYRQRGLTDSCGRKEESESTASPTPYNKTPSTPDDSTVNLTKETLTKELLRLFGRAEFRDVATLMFLHDGDLGAAMAYARAQAAEPMPERKRFWSTVEGKARQKSGNSYVPPPPGTEEEQAELISEADELFGKNGAIYVRRLLQMNGRDATRTVMAEAAGKDCPLRYIGEASDFSEVEYSMRLSRALYDFIDREKPAAEITRAA